MFGSKTEPFPNKKTARANAAKQAVQFLIAEGLTNPDGTSKARKKGTPGNPGKTIKVEGKALEVKMDASYAQKVNGMSKKKFSILLFLFFCFPSDSILCIYFDSNITTLSTRNLPSFPDICPILGLTVPTYRFVATSPSTPNLLSGAAYFVGQPMFPGPVGEVRNVFGKKSAKEECARGVWQVLRRLARSKGVEMEISSEEDDEDDDSLR